MPVHDAAEACHDPREDCGWPPWQTDPDPDRRQARRVRDRAQHGLRQHGDLPEQMPTRQAEQPWQWPADWMNAAWLRGTIAYLDWILGDTQQGPITFKLAGIAPPGVLRASYSRPPTPDDIAAELALLSAVTMQGHEGQPAAEPECYPPPQWGEGVEQAHDWITGEDTKPPADHHGCGGYYSCPASGAAPAKPPGTACAAGAQPAPTTSATPLGPRSERVSNPR